MHEFCIHLMHAKFMHKLCSLLSHILTYLHYFFSVKKLYHGTIFHLFSRVDDIRGHKDNIYATKKTPNKIWCKVSREYIKLKTFTKYQKTKKESS
jgi:hypothetical protein